MMEFRGKTVLVTGAAGAIGKGVAADFAQKGASVYLTDISQVGIDAAVAEIKAATGALCTGMVADVTREEQVIAVVEAAKQAFGGSIDVLINVAGCVAQGKIEDIDAEEWDKIFAVNCKGTFLFIKHVVLLMKSQRSGKIVNYSSKSGKTGSALMAPYSAAKAAIIGLTQALAFELADCNINVNCVCPGITDNTGVWSSVSSGYVREMGMAKDEIVKKFTAKIPLRRLASIEDVVAVTTFLASKGADYMTGQAINITGGREMH
jgi:NAD(P)-dependent dehydrogenase (short-subunit alcohol dehydrogenase family)